MKRLSSALALAATVALFWQSATPAQACVYPEDYDPIAASDLIVGGRLGEWTIDHDISLPPALAQYQPSAVPISVPLTVEHFFKGTSTTELRIVDFRAVDLWEGRYSWEFSVWDCGFFAGRRKPPEPGTYVIFGLNGGDGRIFQEQWTFFSGPQPPGDSYDDALRRLVSADQGSNAPTIPPLIAAVAIPVVFVLTASFVFPAKGSRG